MSFFTFWKNIKKDINEENDSEEYKLRMAIKSGEVRSLNKHEYKIIMNYIQRYGPSQVDYRELGVLNHLLILFLQEKDENE